MAGLAGTYCARGGGSFAGAIQSRRSALIVGIGVGEGAECLARRNILRTGEEIHRRLEFGFWIGGGRWRWWQRSGATRRRQGRIGRYLSERAYGRPARSGGRR